VPLGPLIGPVGAPLPVFFAVASYAPLCHVYLLALDRIGAPVQLLRRAEPAVRADADVVVEYGWGPGDRGRFDDAGRHLGSLTASLHSREPRAGLRSPPLPGPEFGLGLNRAFFAAIPNGRLSPLDLPSPRANRPAMPAFDLERARGLVKSLRKTLGVEAPVDGGLFGGLDAEGVVAHVSMFTADYALSVAATRELAFEPEDVEGQLDRHFAFLVNAQLLLRKRHRNDYNAYTLMPRVLLMPYRIDGVQAVAVFTQRAAPERSEVECFSADPAARPLLTRRWSLMPFARPDLSTYMQSRVRTVYHGLEAVRRVDDTAALLYDRFAAVLDDPRALGRRPKRAPPGSPGTLRAAEEPRAAEGLRTSPGSPGTPRAAEEPPSSPGTLRAPRRASSFSAFLGLGAEGFEL